MNHATELLLMVGAVAILAEAGCKTHELSTDKPWPVGDAWIGESGNTIEQINLQRGVVGK